MKKSLGQVVGLAIVRSTSVLFRHGYRLPAGLRRRVRNMPLKLSSAMAFCVVPGWHCAAWGIAIRCIVAATILSSESIDI
jgi:hypothetical protein